MTDTAGRDDNDAMDPATERFLRYRQRGDLAALGQVFDELAPRLLGLALHLLGNAADAEDALQAAFVRAMQKATTFDPAHPVTGWLGGILAGEAKNLQRREHRRRGEPMVGEPVGGDDPAAAVAHRDLVARLRTHVDGLPDEQRQVLLLQLQHGLEPAEIAEVLGVAPGTVRMRLHRGLATLRGLLPAGLVALAWTALPGRGLAAVRAGVLRAAAKEAAVGLGLVAAVAAGGIAMKVVLSVAVAIAVALVALGWSGAFADGPAPVGGGGRDAVVGQVVGGVTTDEAAAGPTVLPAPESPLRESAPAPQMGSLRVQVRGAKPRQVNLGVFEVDSGEGDPLALVDVVAWPDDGSTEPTATSRIEGRTAAGGETTFEGLDSGTWLVRASCGGATSGPDRVDVPAGGVGRVEIVLWVEGWVRGLVVDADGTPVAGASVAVSTLLRGKGEVGPPVRPVASSDTAGRFVAAYFQGDGGLGATKPGHIASPAVPVHQLGIEGSDVTLRLGRAGGAIEGVVRDERDRPVPGVEVMARTNQVYRAADGELLGAPVPVWTRSGSDGSFVLEGLPPGTYDCEAIGPSRLAAREVVAITAARTATVRLTMRDGHTVHGSVRDEVGRPIGGAWVSVACGNPSQTWLNARTSRDGRFAVQGVPSGEAVVYASRGGEPQQRALSLPGAAAVECDFVLPEEPTLRGRVVGPDGEGLDGFRVTIARDSTAVSAGISTEVSTDGDGGFTALGLQSVEHRLSVRCAHGERIAATGRAVPGAGEPVVLLVPPSELPTARVRGRFVDRDGRPCRGVAWAIDVDDGPPNWPNDDGTFVGEKLAAGQCTLTFEAVGMVSGARQILIEHQAELDLGDLVLQRGAELRVRFRRPDGSPWRERPPVPWLTGDGGTLMVPRQVQYAIDGDEVTASGIAEGTYTVTLPEGDELLAEPRAVALLAGRPVTIEMAATLGRRCELHFPRPDPHADVKVHFVVRDANGKVVRRGSAEGVAGGEAVAYAMLPVGTSTITAEGGADEHYAGSVTTTVAPGDVRVDVPRTAGR